MAIYMFKGTYTQASIQAMVENPVDRTALISKACESFGGKLLNVFTVKTQIGLIMSIWALKGKVKTLDTP